MMASYNVTSGTTIASNSTVPSMLTESPLLKRSKTVVVVEVFCSVCLALISFFGNACVIYAVHRERRLKTITNKFIESLAWTDILNATLVMPFWISNLATGEWQFNHFLCGVEAFLTVVMAVATVNTLTFLTLNRFFKVVKPRIYDKLFSSKMRANLIIISIWLFALIVCSPPFFGWGRFGFFPDLAICSMDWWDPRYQSYVLVLQGSGYMPGTIIICYCYLRIYLVYRKNKKQMKTHARQSGVPQVWTGNQAPGDARLIRISATVVIVYLACWSPVSLVAIIKQQGVSVHPSLDRAAIFLMLFNSCANPLIYGILNPQFKDAFYNIFNCHSFRFRRESSKISTRMKRSSVNRINVIQPTK